MVIPSYQYSFPAIRGIQAGREYYTSMCPIHLIPKIFSFDDEYVPPEMRAQRCLNAHRVPEITRYILENPKDYTFSAITASISAEVTFEPVGTNTEAEYCMGQLHIPMNAHFIINDGQHRRAAIEQALKENPDLGNESIAVVFFLDIGLKRAQQMFTDLNRYASRPDSSLNILYDHRDQKSLLAKAVMQRVEAFRKLTETERSSLTKKSNKLFTLSSIYGATNALLSHHRDTEISTKIDIASNFWSAVYHNMSDWQHVLERKVSAPEIRRDYVHSYSVTLNGIGRIGATLTSLYKDDWPTHLQSLQDIDWLKTNPDWDGRIINGGRVCKSRYNVDSMAAYLKTQLKLPLTPEEERIETVHALLEGKEVLNVHH
ncbi:MAG: DNA sulfur modification protein DndB [Cyanobacteria bacterium P01_G01_bin.54]